MIVRTAGATDPSQADLLALGERIWLATEMACDPIWDLHPDRLGVQMPLQTVGGILATTRGRFEPQAQMAALRIAAGLGDETVRRLTERLIRARGARSVLGAPRSVFLRSLVTLAARSDGPENAVSIPV
ncbi:hypothetical protein Mpop_5157 [Methylorubrum populi BJ001]|jgi:hypothetical protein|uniref:Uncharacterized protein n=1 Tax=Methylorubrum populi (strain ATCC BAA-705 / NCIMB 13946 / BJ001) TaxID=441620 RepID=B1Z8V2_METPB|nr:hypothetical protein [Methylorubrum populi]ACB83252.1 hypothetical protein Mpop_5157 [Methylorubrum populi BJ001]OAH38221.1 hypothetical protein AX289_12240 [Methylorubrum populi]PZP68204.1 MAG: hypothetical protein DI590_17835 [Methylorubrum populi]